MRILFDYLDEGYTVGAFFDQYDIDPDLVQGTGGFPKSRFRSDIFSHIGTSDRRIEA